MGVFPPSKGKFISIAGRKGYKSLEEAMTKDGQLGDLKWKDIPDLTAILEAENPPYPKAPLEKCSRGNGKSRKDKKKWKKKKSKKGDEPMEDEALEDVSAMEELDDEIQDIEEDIDDIVDELEN